MILRLDRGNYVPDSYKDSRDYRVLLKLLGMILSVFKVNIDTLPDLYSADNCPEHLVHLLADMVGYEYNRDIFVDSNRLIVKYYPYMIRRRGSRQGLKLATALTLNTSDDPSDSYSLDNIVIEYDFEVGMIKIYYPSSETLRKDLIEAVRPVGSIINFIPSVISKSTDEIDVKATVRAEIEKYDEDVRSRVDESKVGFGNTDIDIVKGDGTVES